METLQMSCSSSQAAQRGVLNQLLKLLAPQYLCDSRTWLNVCVCFFFPSPTPERRPFTHSELAAITSVMTVSLCGAGCGGSTVPLDRSALYMRAVSSAVVHTFFFCGVFGRLKHLARAVAQIFRLKCQCGRYQVHCTPLDRTTLY